MKDIVKHRLGDWRLHLIVLGIIVVSEIIYIHQIPAGPGVILLLPFLYAFIIGVLLNPNVIPAARRITRQEETRRATPWILIAILPFIAKFGSTVGPAIEEIIKAGPALILQELGNLGTMLIALPVAVLIFRMKREAIGATFSVAREPNLAIIADRYSLKSDEGTGVMGVYISGTLFGTIIFATMTSFMASLDLLHPYSLAMACGVGSASMLAACAGALTPQYPNMEDQILAYAGASNLLTYATGLYVGLFLALPMAEFMYRLMRGGRNEPTPAGSAGTARSTETSTDKEDGR